MFSRKRRWIYCRSKKFPILSGLSSGKRRIVKQIQTLKPSYSATFFYLSCSPPRECREKRRRRRRHCFFLLYFQIYFRSTIGWVGGCWVVLGGFFSPSLWAWAGLVGLVRLGTFYFFGCVRFFHFYTFLVRSEMSSGTQNLDHVILKKPFEQLGKASVARTCNLGPLPLRRGCSGSRRLRGLQSWSWCSGGRDCAGTHPGKMKYFLGGK